MKLEILLTKWSLTGLLTGTDLLYSSVDEDAKIAVFVKLARLAKNGDAGYILYKETVNQTTRSTRYKLLNADITSNLFNTGMFYEGLTISKLDEEF